MKSKLIQQIAAGNTEEAIDAIEGVLKLLQEEYYNWVMLKSQFGKLKAEHLRGTLAHEDFTLETNKTNARVMENYKSLDELIRQHFQESEQYPLTMEGFRDRLQGQLMEKYQLLETLGEGDSIIFYKAKEWHSDRYVTIKALTSQNFTHESKAYSEPDRVRYFKHRNIRAVLDDARLQEYPKYVILEYIDGNDLQEIVEKTGPRPGFETKHILLRICDALYYLHKRKIYNCDLRPSRIIMDEEGEPILTLSTGFKARGDSNYFEIFSDFQYMSPERLSARHGILENDLVSNQFSLGILAYFLITGEHLFDGDSLIEVIEQRQRFVADPEFRAKKFEALRGPDDFIQIIVRLLSTDKNKRFPNIKAVIDALNSCEIASKAHYELARESYQRCTALAPNFVALFLDRLLERLPASQKQLIPETLDRKVLENMLRSCISLIIETSVEESYMNKIKEINEIGSLTRTQFTTIFGVFYGLIAEHDYMWSPEIQEAWELTLEESIQDLTE